LARSDFFRRNAESCFAKAQEVGSTPARAAWLEMALHWHQLAQEAEATSEHNETARPQNEEGGPDAAEPKQP
jgi:hypothetical protein